MAGTLIVQNIQGPASGANANKIIIPSGQTLDASAGTFVPSAGGVLQVVSTIKTDFFTSSSTSFTDVTGYSATMTPSSSSSKILVLVDVFIAATNITAGYWQLVRNTTPVAIGTETASHNITGGFYSESGSSSGYAFTGNGLSYLDSPATTSAITYKVQAKSSGGTVTINRRGTDTTTSAVSTITLMEIAG